MIRNTFLPDWNKSYRSQSDLEKDMNIVYRGPGTYLANSDSVIIYELNKRFYVCVYNGRNPIEDLKAIVNAPTYR